jgi:hypothetical protein
MVEEEFAKIYEADAKLREVLAGSNPDSLKPIEKYEILVAY